MNVAKASSFASILLVAAVAGDCGGPPAASDAYDTTPQPIELIPPGTVVAAEPPQGWSHLIIKSVPRVGAGDVGSVSARAVELAQLLFTAFLARVEEEQAPEGKHYRLSCIAVGVGTPIRGRDTIISPETQEALGANFGVVEQAVLSGFCREQQKVLAVARSDTLALVDTPAVVRRQERNCPMILRYALIVDPHLGRLDAFAWLIDLDTEGNYREALGAVEWLPPSKIERPALYVDASEFTFGIPSKNGFAITAIPHGNNQFEPPNQVAAVIGRQRPSPRDAQQIESWLRSLVSMHGTGLPKGP